MCINSRFYFSHLKSESIAEKSLQVQILMMDGF